MKKTNTSDKPLGPQMPPPDLGKDPLMILGEAIPQIIWTADSDGYQDFFNNRWFEYTGFTLEETYIGKTALHPDDFPVYVKRWSRALIEGKAYEAAYRFRRKDGQYRWHLVRGVPLRNEDGTIAKWIGTFTDIDDRKKAEEKIIQLNGELENKVALRTRELQRAYLRDRANLQLLENMINNMPSAAIALDEKQRVIQVNGLMIMLFGLDNADGLVGGSFDRVSEFIENAVAQSGEWKSRVRKFFSRPTAIADWHIEMNNRQILSCDFVPVLVGSRHKGSLLLFRDITREKRIDAAKSEFMSLASHQLRTPLTSIRWALGRIQRKISGNSPLYPLIEATKKASANMSKTISSMLTIARAQSEDLTVSIVSQPLSRMINESRAEFRQHCREHRQRIIVRCPASLRIHTDPTLLHGILSNIIGNGLKYSPDGSVLKVTAKKEKANVRIEFADRGFGIPAYQHDKIFNKFFRGDNVIHKDTDGTGLGLYLVSLLVKKLNGTVSFISEENKGTTFTLVLPRRIRASSFLR